MAIVIAGLASTGMVWLLSGVVRGLTVDLLQHPDRFVVSLTSAVSGTLLWLVGVGATMWAAVDASRSSPEAFDAAGRGGRRPWLLAPVLAIGLGLGWAVALAYATVVRPRLAPHDGRGTDRATGGPPRAG